MWTSHFGRSRRSSASRATDPRTWRRSPRTRRRTQLIPFTLPAAHP